MRLAKRLGSLALTAGLALGLLASAPASAEALTAAPSGVSAVAPTNTTITVAWKSVKKAAVYSVRYATDKKFKTGKTKRTTEPNVTIKNLVKGTTYYLKVRVLDANLKPVTKYSKAVKVKTPKAKATTLPRPTGLR
ncbi:MAG: fibronectin type III domain-containing protein, partial [Propionibacteriaceae bacterium]|nr:fibronectin type III domain-containing protein [Propionibacteriaceae bacterium]